MQQDYHNDSLNDSRLNESNGSLTRRRRKTLDDYEFVAHEDSRFKTSELGKGAYGLVKKVKDKQNGKIYAMKIMNKKSIFEYSTKENLKREITIQRSISHPHIIRLYTYFEDTENVYLILEFAEKGSLFHYLRRSKKFTEQEAFVYFFQTCLGIDYLHKKNIIHRDLKPENLLLDEDGNIKLCDFGWSVDTDSKRSTFCGTIDYMAPEMIKNQPHDHRLDIWCLGVLLYEMIHGHAPFKGKNDQEKCMNISANSNINFDPSLSSELVDLIKRILHPNPSSRLSMYGIFQHAWMKKLESHYKINIMSYVEQQDEQIKEHDRLQSQREKTLVKERSKNFQDHLRPLDAVAKEGSYGSYGDKFSYNGSTKESETGSIGSGSRVSSSIGGGLTNYLESPVLTNSSKGVSKFTYSEADKRGIIGSYGEKDKYNYSSFVLNQSNNDTNYSKNQELISKIYGKAGVQIKGLIDEEDEYLGMQRMSKISIRNAQIHKKYITPSKEPESPGFFEKLLTNLGCIGRDPSKLRSNH